MANVTKIKASDGVTYNLKDAISGYTSNTGTVTKVSTGAGLVGGDITTSGTLKCDLKSETKSTLNTASRGSTSSREYAVGLDKNGDLSVNIPWSNTTYSAGTNFNISSSNVISMTNIGNYFHSETNSSGGTTSTVANGTYTNLATYANSSLPAGKYFALGVVTWGGNSNGRRILHFATSSAAGSEINRYAGSWIPAYNNNSGDQMKQQVGMIITLSAGQNLHLVGWQNSGVSLSVSYPGIQLIRLG